YLPGVTAPPTAESSAQPAPAASVRAENVAMHALTRRGQSRRELEAILRSRQLDPETIEAELARLEGVGLIDDAALAEQIIRTQRERKRLGRTAVVAELRRRKLDNDTIETALRELDADTDVDDEFGRALALAEQRAGRLSGLDRDTAVRRLGGFLQRKGYSGDVVRHAVSTALSGRALSGRTSTVRFQ
ncbi:MAG TPA: regulatory protein RecX, partial [Terrimesophilobacter sp.]|nr:regulatory protein RecX [Terrimesophilobacter sp.]